jgi:hypothetical protein
MQHYYIPTRLLDWTEVLGVAVFFALLERPGYESHEPAAVYLLDPYLLNSKSRKRDVPMVSDDPGFNYKTLYWEKKPMPPEKPIAIEAPFQNDRMMAQRGKFTIHGDDLRPIEEINPDCVRKVTIPIKAQGSHLKIQV